MFFGVKTALTCLQGLELALMTEAGAMHVSGWKKRKLLTGLPGKKS